MKERTTQGLLALVAALLAAHLFRAAHPIPRARAQAVAQPAAVPGAEGFEMVDKAGKVVAQIHLGEDGGGSIRLRSGDGTVCVKIGANADGSGLILFGEEAEPAVWLAANRAGTSATLAEKGKATKVIQP